MNAIILQHVYEASDYVHLAELTVQRHMRYARCHKMDLAFRMDGKQAGGHWIKVEMIREALGTHEYVIWVDADAVILDVNTDLRQACGKPVNAVRYARPDNDLNVGVLYFRRSPEAIAFVEAWYELRPGKAPTWEQEAFNALAKSDDFAGHVHILPERWNARPDTAVAVPPIVMGWHGVANFSSLTIIREQMQEAMAGYQKWNRLGV